MVWSFATHVLAFLLALLSWRRRTERVKDLEIALLRQQLRRLQLQQTRSARLRPADRALLFYALNGSRLPRKVRTVESPQHQLSPEGEWGAPRSGALGAL